jgi:hypothetical protein
MDKEDSSSRRKSNRSPPYALFNLLVIVVAIIYGAYYKMYLEKAPNSSEEPADVQMVEDEMVKIPLFTAEELRKFDGVGMWPKFRKQAKSEDDRFWTLQPNGQSFLFKLLLELFTRILIETFLFVLRFLFFWLQVIKNFTCRSWAKYLT